MTILLRKKDLFKTYKSNKYANLAWSKYSKLFPIKASPELAGLIADILTDGSMDIRPRLKSTYYGYIAYFSKYRKELNYFHNTLNKIFGVKGKLVKEWGRNHYGNCRNYIVLNSFLTRVIYLLGAPYGNKTNKEYNIPKWILKGNKKIKSIFLKRSFTCEGSISYDKYTRRWELSYSMYKFEGLTNNAMDYLNNLRGLLGYFGIKNIIITKRGSSIRKNDNKKVIGYNLRTRDKGDLRNFYKYIGFDLDYKNKNLLKASNS